MVTRDVLKVLKIALAYGSCNFENFQNITRAHKSRNALAFIRFPILIGIIISIYLVLVFIGISISIYLVLVFIGISIYWYYY